MNHFDDSPLPQSTAKEQDFRLLADTIPQLVWITNMVGDVKYINARWFEYTGQTPGEWTRETWISVVHPDDLSGVIIAHQTALKNRSTMELEYRIQRKDGAYRWHLARTVFMPENSNGIEIRFGTATDIHDHKEMSSALADTQQELRNSRDQLDFILQGVGAGVIAHDPGGRVIFVNDLAAHKSGFDTPTQFKKASQSEIHSRIEMWNEDGSPLISEMLPSRLALQGIEAPSEKVVKYRLKNETAFKWSVHRSKALLDLHGQVMMVVTLVRDITDRKNAELEREKFHEEALTERARLKAVIEQVETGVLIMSAGDKKTIFSNEKLREIWRVSELPIDASARYRLLRGFRLDGTELRLSDWPSYRCIASGITVKDEEYEILRGDRSRAYIKISATPIRDAKNEVIAAVVAVQDVTEIRKQQQIASFLDEANQVLSSSLEYHRTLGVITKLAVPKLGDWCSISIIDENGPGHFTVAHEDPSMLALAEEFRIKYPTDWNAETGTAQVLRSGVSKLYPLITEEMLAAAAIDRRHLELLIALKLHSVIMVPISSHSSTFGVLTLISSDPVRQYDHRDLKTAEALALRAGQAIENAKLYEQAQNAIRSRDSLISVSAHELLTPVSGSKLQMQLMRKRMSLGHEITPAMIAKMVDQTERQLDRLSRLVNEMLDLSRINLGKLTIEKNPTALSELITDIVERMQGHMDAAACKVCLQIEQGIHGNFDSYRLEQVLSNLLSNAARYARGKSVVVALHAENADWVNLSVIDEGIGVRKEDQERIFQRFERAATIDEGSGLGLGLFVVKQIVEAHGGTVSLESEFGKGSKFIVRLPLGTGVME